MILLKVSTAATLRVGPFVDAADGVTPETGVTLGAADQAELLKHSGATVDISGSTFAAITGVGGWYDLSLTSGNTDTVGMLTVVIQDSSVCLPVFARAMVVPAVVWDSLVGGTDTLHVDAQQWLGGTIATPTQTGVPEVDVTHWIGTAASTPTTAGVPEVDVIAWLGTAAATPTVAGVPEVDLTHIAGSTNPATQLGRAANTMKQGTVDNTAFTATATIFETSSITEATADHFNGRLVMWTSGALQDQQATIEDYALSAGRGRFTVTTMTEAPANGDAFEII